MRMYKLISIYVISYCVFGIVTFLLIFGFTGSLGILKSSPMTNPMSGTTILLSLLLASIIVIPLMKKRLSVQPYAYFMLGFYIGNLSLLLMVIIDLFLYNYITWKYPEFLLIAPFVGLFLSYRFGFAFIALIPAWLSAYILFKVMQKQKK